jgi:hypothetical protein
MAYAFRADLHNPSRETRTALINQLDDLISKYDKEGRWLYDLIPRLKGHCNFLEISTLGGLGGYVKDRLRMVDDSRLEATTSLLRFVLSEEPCRVDRLLFRDLEILSILLEFGADVGKNYPSLLHTL